MNAPAVVTGLSAFAAAVWGGLWLRNLADARLTPRLRPPAEPPDPGPDPPLVSILVPARNEASRDLRRCVESMLGQAWPRLEVVAVNDRSTDATLAILEALAATPAGAGEGVERHPLVVIDGAEPPPGWLGKTHALHQALQAARGEWVLATDADIVFLSPHAVAVALAAAREHGADAVTCLPGSGGHAGVDLVMPVVAWMIFLVYPPRATNNPADPRALGCGGFFLIRRAALDAVGGYEPIRADLADDVATAERLKSRGFRLHCAIGPDLLYTPMYADLAELWAGFGKNAMRGLAHSYVNGLRSVALMVLGGVVPVATAAVVGGLLVCGRAAAWRPVLWGSLTAWLMMAGAFTPVFGQYGRSRWRALTAPFAFGLMAALLCSVMWRAVRGTAIQWRGRDVAPHGPASETPRS